MKKIKNLEILKHKYLYERNNGTITKYIVDEDYYISVETGIATKKDETIFLGKTSENIIVLIEVGDIVEVLDHDWTRVFNIDDEDILESFIEDCKEENWRLQGIMTREIYKQNCYKIDTNQ